jgi:integrase
LAKKKIKRRKRTPWNKGVEVGQRAPFSAAEVTRIRKLLVKRGDAGLSHRALFSTALDTMLRSPDLVGLTVKDVRKRNGVMRDTFVLSPKGRRTVPVRCTLSKATMSVLEELIRKSGKRPRDYLFTGRVGGGLKALSYRQLNRILRSWVVDIGLDGSAYGMESLRRTRAVAILNRTGDMEAVRDLLGLKDIYQTEKYLSSHTQ